MIKNYPTAIVCVCALAALFAALYLVPLDTLRWVVGVGALAVLPLLAAMRGIFHDDDGAK